MKNPLFIFEIANNHMGDMAHAEKIIKEYGNLAKQFGVSAALKLQYRNLETFIHDDFKNSDIKHIKRFRETALTNEQFKKLISLILENNLITCCTPFDESSVDLITEHNVEIVKVASCSANDWPLLEKISTIKKDVILSTGGLNFDEISKAVTFFEHKNKTNISILHCIGLYPTPNNKQQLWVIDALKKQYKYDIGYSGHENPENLIPGLMAIAKGAVILERHIGIETENYKLNDYSMNLNQTRRWIENCLNAFEANGMNSDDKKITDAEKASLDSLKRGVYSKCNINKSTNIRKSSVYFALPKQENQIDTSEFSELIISSKDYNVNEKIIDSNEIQLDSIIRKNIRWVKSYMARCNVNLGSNFKFEISHHYGIDNLEKYGAYIYTVINRDYCKKIIVIMPGQRHPNHKHKKKEETFQIISGELKLLYNNNEYNLKSGDSITIEKNNWHAFSSSDGCIFEEISTTHYVDDSYYEDVKISLLDPISRKTYIDKI